MLELVLRGSWEALRSLNKEIPCYGLTRDFLVRRQIGPQVGAMLKLVLGGVLERSRKGFGGVLEVSWGCLGASWARLGASWRRLGGVLEASWGVLGRLGGIYGASWGVLGVSMGSLGASMCFDGLARVSRAAAQLAFFVADVLDVYEGRAFWNVFIDSLFHLFLRFWVDFYWRLNRCWLDVWTSCGRVRALRAS